MKCRHSRDTKKQVQKTWREDCCQASLQEEALYIASWKAIAFRSRVWWVGSDLHSWHADLGEKGGGHSEMPMLSASVGGFSPFAWVGGFTSVTHDMLIWGGRGGGVQIASADQCRAFALGMEGKTLMGWDAQTSVNTSDIKPIVHSSIRFECLKITNIYAGKRGAKD